MGRQTFAIKPEMLSPDPSPFEKDLFDRFVTEYLVDFDAYAASLRLGFNSTFANERSKLFLMEPYIQRQIAKRSREAPEDPAKTISEDIELVKTTLRRSMQQGSNLTQVQAASRMAEIHGLGKNSNNSDVEAAIAEALASFATRAPA